MYQSLFALFRAERNADSELCSVRVTSDPDLAPFRIKQTKGDIYILQHPDLPLPIELVEVVGAGDVLWQLVPVPTLVS